MLYHIDISIRNIIFDIASDFLSGTQENKSKSIDSALIKRLTGSMAAAVLAISIIGMAQARAAGVFLSSNFDSGGISGWGRHDGKIPGALTVQSNVVRAGKYAVRYHMKRCSWVAPKCGPKPVNLSRPRVQLTSTETRFYPGKEYWIGASIFIPNDWVFDNLLDAFLNLHRQNNANGPGTCTPGFKGRQSFSLGMIGNQWTLGYTTSNPKAKKFGDYSTRSNLAPVQKGKWTDFVFNFKLAYGNDGFQKIWINGKQVRNHKGSTICPGSDRSNNAKIMPYLVAPIYKAGWQNHPGVKERTAYYDEIRVGDSSASYRDVAPHGVQKANTAAKVTTIETPAAARKPVSKKGKRKLYRSCNNYKGKKRKSCTRKVRQYNQSLGYAG